MSVMTIVPGGKFHVAQIGMEIENVGPVPIFVTANTPEGRLSLLLGESGECLMAGLRIEARTLHHYGLEKPICPACTKGLHELCVGVDQSGNACACSHAGS